jgi:hypothetical protein
MKTQVQRPNGNKIKGKSFKSILNEMMKLISGGNLKVANKHWDIHYKPTNNVSYGSPVGA